MSTQAQLDSLKAARALGVAEVTYEGKTVKYRSLDHMDRVIADLERELGGPVAAQTAARQRRRYMQTSRGI